MKLFIFLISFTTAIYLSSCCGDCDDRYPPYYHSPLYISSPTIKYEGKLYFQYYSQQGEQGENERYKLSSYNMNKSYLFELDTSTHTWKKIASKINNNITILNDYNETKIQNLYKPFDRYSTDKMLINDNYYVVIEQNGVKIKQLDSNALVEQYLLPSLYDTVSNLGISYNTFEKIEYYPLFNHTYNSSKKEYLALLFFDKQRVQAGDKYNYYYATIKFKNNSWNYNIIKKGSIQNIHEYRNNLNQNLSLTFNDGNLTVSYDTNFYDTDSNYQIIMEDGNISFVTPSDLKNKKNIYTQIIEKNYYFREDAHYFGNYGVSTFDEKGNMHLFYNKRDDIKNENFDYFWYGYFTKENPTIPLYEQKIPWK